ncbi:hypothetical protein BAE44_0000970 [Dichanthelium oligosanthes]|uniref:Uncharacterized protein n=1 Tax=Dichanthelium oligosanthes TaxID=888268 RepID=A0A1E5WKR2_9POAL|nr:hypothetical protein BAE44_0000970 [Dichanthelium oligosanthes]
MVLGPTPTQSRDRLPEPAEEPKAETKAYEPLAFEGGYLFQAWKEEADEFEADFGKIETKIHRFPPSLRGLGVRYMAPRVVAIGPYHLPSSLEYFFRESSNDLRQMERVKDLAAYHFFRESGHSLEEMFSAVFAVQGHARGVYTRGTTKNMKDDKFAYTMLRDGCFLLQFMLMCTGARHELAPSLLSCLSSNQAVISHDIMLLENQIPWVVIETLRRFRTVPVEEFIAKMGRTLQGSAKARAPLPEPTEEPKAETKAYQPLVFQGGDLVEEAWKKEANEFEADFGKIETKIHRFPPSLRGLGVRYMAPRAVAELTNRETLDFFKTLIKHISGGTLYDHILGEIEDYKLKRWMWIKVRSFVYKNLKIIITVFSIIGVIVGIFKALLSLKKH